MGIEEKWAAYGVNACPRNHVLRSRHGSCLMCNSQSIAHLLRAKQSGYLYIAVGAAKQFMKLGFSQDPAARIRIANYDGWGGYYDWRMIAQAWSRTAGKLEHEFLGHFSASRVSLEWVRNGRAVVTKEAFVCDTNEALSKLVWLCELPPEIMYG